MSSNVKEVLQSAILYFDELDSTNNYAAKLIDADKAHHGTTIVTKSQTAGKGQRSKSWQDVPNNSLLMSIIIEPKLSLDKQFLFLAAIANAVVNTLIEMDESITPQIKYPNDIILNDKKTAGILIENVIRGNQWSHAVVGIGINVLQEKFENQLVNAGSLLTQCGKRYNIESLLQLLRAKIMGIKFPDIKEGVVNQYNNYLYKADLMQMLKIDRRMVEVKILGVNNQGFLNVAIPGQKDAKQLMHGNFEWIW